MKRRTATICAVGLAALAGGVAVLTNCCGVARPPGEPEVRAEAPPSATPPGLAPAPAGPMAPAVSDARAAPTADAPAVATSVRLRLVTGDGRPVGPGWARLDGTKLVPDGPFVVGLVHFTPAVPVAADGRTTIPLDGWPSDRSGTLEVRVAGRGRLQSAAVDLRRSEEQTVTVSSDGDETLRGRVVTEDGTPVPGLSVRVARGVAPRGATDDVAGDFRVVNEGDAVPFGRLGDDEVGAARTDAAGVFELAGVTAGTHHVSDVGPGWLLRDAVELSSGSPHPRSIVAVPACSAVVHVRSGADGAPLRPSHVFVELWSGRGTTGVGPYDADVSVRWPRARSPQDAEVKLELEAPGHLPTRVVVRAGPGAPTRERTVELAPLPPGLPGSLRLAVVTRDAAFLDGSFQLELRVASADAADGAPDAASDPWAEGTGALVVARAQGLRDGDGLRFEGVPAGAWSGRVRSFDAIGTLAWEGSLAITPATEAKATWLVPAHGRVVLRGRWPTRSSIQVCDAGGSGCESFFDGFGRPMDGRRIALPTGTWTVSWPSDDDPRFADEVVVDVTDGGEHELRRDAPAPDAR